MSERRSWLMAGVCGLLLACASSRTGSRPEPIVRVPAVDESTSAPMPASEDAEGSAPPSASADAGKGNEFDSDAIAPPHDCRECENLSDSARFQEADGTGHSCGRSVDTVYCGVGRDDEEDNEYCTTEERCDPRCCK